MFDALKPLAPDAILGIMQLFRADQDPRKVDLSVGVYQDDAGETPVLQSVKEAEQRIFAAEKTKSYVAISGNDAFNAGAERLIFGADSALLASGRVSTVQAPGGSGALSVAGHLIQRVSPGATVHMSDPSWPNHSPLLGLAGLRLATYPYYDRTGHRVDFDAMRTAIATMAAGDFLLLHGCCHNPSGADLSREQWEEVAELCRARSIIPFVDFAYQGLAEGIDTDAFGLRHLAATVPELVVVSSCSKNFGLYRERVGSCSVVAARPEHSDNVFGNLKSVARSIYSMPPNHGAAIVATILDDPELKALWVSELDTMRTRLNGLRQLLVEKLSARQDSMDFSFIAAETGMFSFLGLSREQIVRLREEFHVYMVESSRINIAGVNSRNVDYIADSVAAVL